MTTCPPYRRTLFLTLTLFALFSLGLEAVVKVEISLLVFTALGMGLVGVYGLYFWRKGEL